MKVKDDLRTPLLKLIRKYRLSCGCDYRVALRDLQTEILHICHFEVLDFDELLKSAKEVYKEEI